MGTIFGVTGTALGKATCVANALKAWPTLEVGNGLPAIAAAFDNATSNSATDFKAKADLFQQLLQDGKLDRVRQTQLALATVIEGTPDWQAVAQKIDCSEDTPLETGKTTADEQRILRINRADQYLARLNDRRNRAMDVVLNLALLAVYGDNIACQIIEEIADGTSQIATAAESVRDAWSSVLRVVGSIDKDHISSLITGISEMKAISKSLVGVDTPYSPPDFETNLRVIFPGDRALFSGVSMSILSAMRGPGEHIARSYGKPVYDTYQVAEGELYVTIHATDFGGLSGYGITGTLRFTVEQDGNLKPSDEVDQHSYMRS